MEVECPRHPRVSTIGSQLLHYIDDIIYTGETRGGGGRTTQKLCLKACSTVLQWTHEGSTRIWTTEEVWLHRLTLAQSMHWCRCTNKHGKTQGKADPSQMYWRMRITTAWTPQGNKKLMLFLVNSNKLFHLTALKKSIFVINTLPSGVCML